MKKKLFVLFSCLLLMASILVVPIRAEQAWLPSFDISAEDFYNYIQANESMFVTATYNGSETYFRAAFGSWSFTLAQVIRYKTGEDFAFDPSKVYKITCNSRCNMSLTYRTNGVDTVYTFGPNESTFSVTTSNFYSLMFLATPTDSSFTSFVGLTLEEIPDVPPVPPTPPGSDEFNTVATFVSTSAGKFWNTLSDCWWAMAFVCLPLVYALFCLVRDFSAVSDYGFMKYPSRLVSSIRKRHEHEKARAEKELREQQKKAEELRVKGIVDSAFSQHPDHEYIMLDGKRYYNPRYKDKPFFFRIKDDFSRKGKSSGSTKDKSKGSTSDWAAYDLDLFEQQLNSPDP